jgi:hypothetical protein
MPADAALKEAISTAAYWIQAHLQGSGKWGQAQLEAAQQHGQTRIPDILSTHLCRETAMFTRAMLEAAGFTGWMVVNGQVDISDLENVPEDITDMESLGEDDEPKVVHTWLVNEDAGLLLDMTAEQFGPDFWHEPAPMLADLCHVSGYEPAEEQADWYDPGSTLPETVGDWLNLPEGAPATPVSKPLARRPEPLPDMLRLANGEPLPEQDEAGERLMVLLQMLEEIREEKMEPAVAPGAR